MVDNELNSDEYNSKRSRDRPLACVLASRMLASYVPLTERWPDACHRSRRYSARHAAGSMQHRERVSLKCSKHIQAGSISGSRQNNSVYARVWDRVAFHRLSFSRTDFAQLSLHTYLFEILASVPTPGQIRCAFGFSYRFPY